MTGTPRAAIERKRRKLRIWRSALLVEMRKHHALRQRVREIDVLTGQLEDAMDDMMFEMKRDEMHSAQIKAMEASR